MKKDSKNKSIIFNTNHFDFGKLYKTVISYSTEKECFFIPKTILVFQMFASEEQNQIIRTEKAFHYLLFNWHFEMSKMKELCGMKCKHVLFDSLVDKYDSKTSILNNNIIGKSKLLFIIIADETTESHGSFYFIGYYCDDIVSNRINQLQQLNNKSIHFLSYNKYMYHTSLHNTSLMLTDNSDSEIIILPFILACEKYDLFLSYNNNITYFNTKIIRMFVIQME